MSVIVIAELFHYPWRWQWWWHVFHKYPLYRLSCFYYCQLSLYCLIVMMKADLFVQLLCCWHNWIAFERRSYDKLCRL